MECEETIKLNSTLPANNDDPIRLINQYLQNNEHEKAYNCLLRLISEPDATAADCNLAGLVAMTLKNQGAAREHFNQAVQIDPQDHDSAYNLAILNMLEEDYDRALKIFVDLDERHPGNAQMQNDLAVVWLNKENSGKAMEYFDKALEIDPNYDLAREHAVTLCIDEGLTEEANLLLKKNAENSNVSEASLRDIEKLQQRLDNTRNKPAHSDSANVPDTVAVCDDMTGVANQKIAFIASHQAFIQDIMRDLAVANEVRLFDGTSVEQLSELLDWADLAWFEWCDNLIIAATQLPKKCKIICRLHSYEAFTDMPAKVDWSKVDRLVFVNPSVQEIFEQQVSARIVKHVIYNGVEVTRFRIPENKPTGKKIASVGYINYKKNPALLLYCFKKIHQYDPEYSFHVAGDHQDPRIQLYFTHFLKENPLPIHFDGWVEDMPAWYADKDFVISTSLFESFHYSIAEGMASGLLPLIHNWYGARNLYPGKYLFDDPDQCLNLLKQLESSDRKKMQTENRELILNRYNQVDKSEEISDLVRQIMRVDVTADVASQKADIV